MTSAEIVAGPTLIELTFRVRLAIRNAPVTGTGRTDDHHRFLPDVGTAHFTLPGDGGPLQLTHLALSGYRILTDGGVGQLRMTEYYGIRGMAEIPDWLDDAIQAASRQAEDDLSNLVRSLRHD